jgi:hypothetical protein
VLTLAAQIAATACDNITKRRALVNGGG